MLECKKLQTSLPNHQIINMVVIICCVCSNIYSLHAHNFAKYVFSFWSVNINPSI